MPRSKTKDVPTSTKAKLKIADLRKVEPLNQSQQKFFDFFKDEKKQIIMAHGVAGTGKTYIALYKAIESVLKQEFEKVLIIRSAVQSREIGHLPGDLEEKLEQYQLPYKQICGALFAKKVDNLVYPDPYERMMKQDNLDFASTSFVRGLTFDNTIVIVDECQNLNWEELDTIITRVGDHSRIIFCGDYRQTDLKRGTEKEGLFSFMEIVRHMKSYARIEFTVNDIVRSDLVKEYIIAKIKAEDDKIKPKAKRSKRKC
jgi:predicted ribonuclease YlaK